MFSSDYEPATFEPGESVETNHALLGGLRDNDFEITDSAYTVGEGCAASILWFLCVCQLGHRLAGCTTPRGDVLVLATVVSFLGGWRQALWFRGTF